MISNDPSIKKVVAIQQQILDALQSSLKGPGAAAFKRPEIPDPAKFVNANGVLDAKGFMAFLKAHQPVDAWTDNDQIGAAIDKGSFEVAAPAAVGPSMYDENLKDQTEYALNRVPGLAAQLPAIVGDPAAGSGLFKIINDVAANVKDPRMIPAGVQRIWFTFYKQLMANPVVSGYATSQPKDWEPIIKDLQAQSPAAISAILQNKMGAQQ